MYGKETQEFVVYNQPALEESVYDGGWQQDGTTFQARTFEEVLQQMEHRGWSMWEGRQFFVVAASSGLGRLVVAAKPVTPVRLTLKLA